MTLRHCPHCHAAITLAEWLTLRLVGTVDYGDGPLEMRDHTCVSPAPTLSVAIGHDETTRGAIVVAGRWYRRAVST